MSDPTSTTAPDDPSCPVCARSASQHVHGGEPQQVGCDLTAEGVRTYAAALPSGDSPSDERCPTCALPTDDCWCNVSLGVALSGDSPQAGNAAEERVCPAGDPGCPCPDGLLCHYADDPEGGTKAWPLTAPSRDTDDLRERMERELNHIHFNGQFCGSDNPTACSVCYGPSPLDAREVVEALLDGPVGELRAEVERLREAVERVRAIYDAWMAWDGSPGPDGNIHPDASSPRNRERLRAALADGDSK